MKFLDIVFCILLRTQKYQISKSESEAHNLSEEKASRVCVEMGSHLLTKQFWLFPCEGRIAQIVCLSFCMEEDLELKYLH